MSKIYSKNCYVCGILFEAHAYNSLYCSGKCKNKAQYKRDPERSKIWAKNNIEKRRRWSREYHHKMMENPQYVARKRRNSREYKLKHPLNGFLNHDKEHFDGNKLPAMQRDSFTCKVCGFVGGGYVDHKLAVHHIDGNRKNNSLENLITLCDSCHKYLTGYQAYVRFLNSSINRELVLELARKIQ